MLQAAPQPTWVDFLRQLTSATRGDFIIYHRGFLLFDRYDKRRPLEDRKRLKLLAEAAWKAYEDQKCTLVQRRHGENEYHYIAVKIAGPKFIRLSNRPLLGS